jgi:hypothetical protein
VGATQQLRWQTTIEGGKKKQRKISGRKMFEVEEERKASVREVCLARMALSFERDGFEGKEPKSATHLFSYHSPFLPSHSSTFDGNLRIHFQHLIPTA